MAFSEQDIQAVWEKGETIPTYDSNKWRKDKCGAWMTRSEYGNRDSDYGWEIDHITPKEDGGTDKIDNLRPLQWENNASKSSGRLVCVVISSGTKNVKKK